MVLLESVEVPLGSEAPNFSLKNIDGKMCELRSFENAKVFVIIFMCNHCPYVQAIWPRLVNLQSRFKEEGVQFVGINPNLNPEYPEETYEKMKEYYMKYNMNFPYLQDGAQEVAKAYKAQCTPDIYVYDKDLKLAYHGRLDDNWQDEKNVVHEELSEAIKALLRGENPDIEQKPSMGCSIKWRE